MKKTEMNLEFQTLLNNFSDKLFKLNQKAIVGKEDDIKYNTCYLIEIIEPMIEKESK